MPQRIYEPGQLCAYPGCPKQARHRGWCSTHYERWRKHGDPSITLLLQGVVTTYSGIHGMLRRVRGPASELPCIDCGVPARSWSYSHECPDEQLGRHGKKALPFCPHVECYSPRCEPCHTRYDAGR